MPLKSQLKQEGYAVPVVVPAAGENSTVYSESGSVSTAGSARLTPKEAAEAIAALEEARLARQEEAAGTIAVDEIIQQFGIEATPEQILAAVEENRRAAQQQARAGQVGGRRRLPATFAILSAFLGLAAGGLLAAGLLSATPRVAMKVETVPAAMKPAAASTQVAPPTDSLTVIDTSSGHAVDRLLSEVPDGRPVQVDAAALRSTFSIPTTKDFEYPQGSNAGTWTLVKRAHRVFLKGFLPLPVSPGVVALGNLVITNQALRPNGMPIGPEPTPVWVPLDNIRSADTYYGTEAGVKEGDNQSGTFAADGQNWSRVIVSDLKPGDLEQSAAPIAKGAGRSGTK